MSFVFEFFKWCPVCYYKCMALLVTYVFQKWPQCFFQMKDVLQITPHEIKDTLTEMAYSLIEAGLIKKTKKYKGPEGGEQEEEGEKKEEGEGTEGEDKPKENGDVKDEDKNEDDLKKVRWSLTIKMTVNK